MNAVDRKLLNLEKIDKSLVPYFGDIRLRLERYNVMHKALAGREKLSECANGYMYFGFHRTSEGWVFREWLPGADEVFLVGDFNGWNRDSHPLKRLEGGIWEIFFDGSDSLCHGQYVKLLVRKGDEIFERIPAYIRRAPMDENTWRLCGQIWAPEEDFPWTDGEWYKKKKHSSPLIYEAHIGMAQEKCGIGTFREFADFNLEHIADMGYNTIQLMAIAEHPYYASFGYQVTNFFAPSYRFGTPEDLKYLIDKAHGMGLAVLLDVVHSHACMNDCEGLHRQDGTEGCYFLEGERGYHPAWKTRCFDYSNTHVLHFLLSNLKYWQEEFHFDGFRFDGVTSMLYENHGLGVSFTDYGQYYSPNSNIDAAVYLMLANELVHSVNKKAVTVAEDMSGMPGLCLAHKDAGFGFDYRLAMGVPDMWIKLIKEYRMEDWDLFTLWHELTTSREGEKSVGYCESHDQAMVGDKTIIFRLADAEMYAGMERSYHSLSMDTAIDMHKLIRLLTITLAKNGYLNFMGNEFGHPEWIDFPREGNGWSYHYARRQWSLMKDGFCKFEWLAAFDRAMTGLVKKYRLHTCTQAKSLMLDNQKSTLIFERGGLLFAFNLHPNISRESVFISCANTGEGDYKVVFSSDDAAFGGSDRIRDDYIYTAKKCVYGVGFDIYLPARCAVVLKKKK